MYEGFGEGSAPNPDFSRAYIVPDSEGGYIAGSSDGFEVLTPASTPEEALENLEIAKIVEGRKADADFQGVELGIISPDDPRSDEELFSETCRAFDYDPDEIRRTAEQEERDEHH